MFSLLCLFSIIYYASSWKIENTQCNVIINNIIENSYDPTISSEWNYPYLQSQIKKNVHCAVVYSYDNRIIIVDNYSPKDISLQNMHVMKITPELSKNAIEIFQKKEI